MDRFVADPDWHWWIILYFFLGGIAAGAYFTAALVDVAGGEDDRALSRIGYGIAFPLVLLCGLFLILDLSRPGRFWHMLLKSEVVAQALAAGWPWAGPSWRTLLRAPLLKYWSPMSVGAWALLLFGGCTFLSWLGSLWPGRRLARRLRHGLVGRGIQVVGAAAGFFIASYTGALLTATNQPLWSDSTWIGPLFLTSAASTGMAAVLLLGRFRGSAAPQAVARLERADRWAVGLELGVFLVFLASLGTLLVPLLATWHGKVFVAGTFVFGLLIPLAVHWPGQRWSNLAAVSALAGGFILRYALLTTPPELLARAPEFAPRYAAEQSAGPRPGRGFLPGFSPENGRTPGGGPGADPENRPAELRPRSKVFHDD